MSEKWEQVTHGTERLRVAGGWLYRWTADYSQGVAMCFVPDPPREVA
jgi:hypothetical protein